MALELAGLDLTFSADNSLVAKQYYAVELSGNFQVSDCDGATDLVIGVLQNKPGCGIRRGGARVRRDQVGQRRQRVTTAGLLVGTDGTGLATSKTTA